MTPFKHSFQALGGLFVLLFFVKKPSWKGKREFHPSEKSKNENEEFLPLKQKLEARKEKLAGKPFG